MRYLVLAALLTLGGSFGCAAFTPSEIQSGVAVAHQNIDAIRSTVAWISSLHPLNPKLMRNLDAIAANLSAMDTLLNR